MNNNQTLIKRIAKNAIVLAIYVVLTFVSTPISFSGIQFRLSGLVVLLCFFNRDYVIAVTLGCLLSNLASPFMPWDLLIGTAGTFLSALAISFSRHLGMAMLFPIIANSFLVAVEYTWYLEWDYWYSVGIIALGETVVMIVSYILCLWLMKKESLQKLIDAKQNTDFKW